MEKIAKCVKTNLKRFGRTYILITACGISGYIGAKIAVKEILSKTNVVLNIVSAK